MSNKTSSLALYYTAIFSTLLLGHLAIQAVNMSRKNRKAVAEIQADHMAVLKVKLTEVAELAEDGKLEPSVAQAIVDIQVEKAVLETSGYYWWAGTLSKLVFCSDVSLSKYRQDCAGICL